MLKLVARRESFGGLGILASAGCTPIGVLETRDPFVQVMRF
jgi:hypothetical protein